MAYAQATPGIGYGLQIQQGTQAPGTTVTSGGLGGGQDPYQQYLNQIASTSKNLLGQWQQKYNEAYQANLSRYNEGLQNLGGYGQQGGVYGRALGSDSKDAQGRPIHTPGYIDQLGKQTQKNLTDQYAASRGMTQQQLIDNGLANTTAAATSYSKLNREQSRAQGELNQNLAQQRMSADTGLTDARNQWIFNRNDTYPSGDPYSMGMNAGVAQADANFPGVGGGGGIGYGGGAGAGGYQGAYSAAGGIGPSADLFGGGGGAGGAGGGGYGGAAAARYRAFNAQNTPEYKNNMAYARNSGLQRGTTMRSAINGYPLIGSGRYPREMVN